MNNHKIFKYKTLDNLLCHIKKPIIVLSVVNQSIHEINIAKNINLSQQSIEGTLVWQLKEFPNHLLKARKDLNIQNSLKNGGANIQRKERRQDKEDKHWLIIQNIYKNYLYYFQERIILIGRMVYLKDIINIFIKNLKTKLGKGIILLAFYVGKQKQNLVILYQFIILTLTRKIMMNKISVPSVNNAILSSTLGD